MALYLVLHHRNDANVRWNNAWREGSISVIDAITTNEIVAKLCIQCQHNNSQVYIHRCAYGEDCPTICCVASVCNVTWINRNEALVTFNNQTEINQRPPDIPRVGQNYYEH